MIRNKIYLFNTLSRKKEEFKPQGKIVGLYTCGPTVYDYDHIGHAWNYTQADLLRRTLEFNDYQVRHVMNITDVGHLTSDADTGEDKIEKSAKEKEKSAWEIAEYYSKIFFANCRKLNILRPHIICWATDHLRVMINLIKKLEQKGATYKTSDGIYFDITYYPKYGQLSGNPLEKLKAGARVEVNPEKRHPADFALWKFSPKDKKRQMEWPSPWGIGFPGWHLECSAMSMKYLGETFDFHTGGEDNIFPHHESEIAQSETATGKPFVRFWFHPRFLKVEGGKMSKSLKNYFTLQDLEKKRFSPLALRYLFLTAHYRGGLNFTWKGLAATQQSLNSLYNLIKTYDQPKIGCAEFEQKFTEAINDDLNIPKALAVMWNLIKSNYPTSAKKQSLLIMDKVLGLGFAKIKKEKLIIPLKIKKLLQERQKVRAEKNWIKADELRKQIEKMGYKVKDNTDATSSVIKI